MRIYFSGIGGVGIGPLAEIASDAGYEVLGSDSSQSLTVKELEERGVQIDSIQNGLFLEAEHAAEPIDWFVYTAALAEDHPELVTARQLGIKTTKRDELLAHIVSEKKLKLIAVAGTHGKTTTTGMLVWTLKQLGLPVSYSVGTTLTWGPSGLFDPESEYFVYECDEFDRNFLTFHPYISLITSLEYDHPDTYPTKDSYLDAFSQFARQSQHIIGWHDELEKLTFSSTSWQLKHDEITRLNLAGEHNRRNGTLVLKACEYLGFGSATDALISFPGTNRRFERLADCLYTDYGHTPAEIAATLQMARELSSHITLVYQPHQNIRQHEIAEQYTSEIFKDANEIYWLPTYLSREDPNLDVLTPEELTKKIDVSKLHISDLDEDLWSEITKHRDADHLVLCMGAGSIDGWLRKNESIRKVANTIIIDSSGNFILQQRDDKPEINNPGMITGFGGAVEEDETVRQAAARELSEETNLSFLPDKLEYFTDIFQQKVNDGKPRWVSYFLLRDQDVSDLKVYEGQGYVSASRSDLKELNLSPTIRKALKKLV